MSHNNISEQSTDASAPPPRRGFLQAITTLISATLGIIPAAIAAVFFADPLIRKRGGSDPASDSDDDLTDFVPLGITGNDLPADGTPLAVKVKSDKVDAWNRFKDIEVGTVWLRSSKTGEIIAFSSVCPHLGCAVDYRSTNQDFFCPCHTSSFDLEGERTNQIPPRGMDQLEIRTEDNGALWIKYETFRAGTPDKIRVT